MYAKLFGNPIIRAIDSFVRIYRLAVVIKLNKPKYGTQTHAHAHIVRVQVSNRNERQTSNANVISHLVYKSAAALRIPNPTLVFTAYSFPRPIPHA